MRKLHLLSLATLTLAALAAPLDAQQIVQSRGYDSRVDYVSLAEYGPWDDRNYELTQDDLARLADNELERRPGVPLFYRLEILDAQPALRDPARRYPRSALNRFFGQYGGFLIDGKLYRHVEVVRHEIRVDAGEGVDQEAFEARGHEVFAKVNGWNVRNLRIGAETAVAFKPGSSTIAVAGINDGLFGQTMAYTTNGGGTWTPGTAAAPFPDSCCDPTVDWSADGSKVYAATLRLSGQGDVVVFRSGDDGQSWTDLPGVGSRTALGEVGADKEFLHVDKHPSSPFRDRVYLCWHTANVQRFAFSTDQAETFSKRTVAGGSGRLGIGCDMTTNRRGRLYYVWPAFNSRRILFRRSADGGRSFQAVRAIGRTQAAFDYPIPAMHQRFAFVYVTAAADLSDGPFADAIYVAWTDTYEPDSRVANRNHSRVRVAYSRDDGNSWTVTTPHPTRDRNTVDRFHPWLAVDPDGVVHMIYYDTERSAERRGVDVIHAISRTGGQTWTRRRVTAQVAPRLNDGFQFGDYNGLDAGAARLLATWTGNSDNEAAGQAARRNN